VTLRHPDRVSIAIIGSFRRHYSTILAAMEVCERAGLNVCSPQRSRIIDPRREFVRLEVDPAHLDDPEVELRALRRILSADLVYVVAPDGYVGNTTCYEIGRVEERGLPLFFSEKPADLPIVVAKAAVVRIAELVREIRSSGRIPVVDDGDLSEVTRRLRADLKRSHASRAGQRLG